MPQFLVSLRVRENMLLWNRAAAKWKCLGDCGCVWGVSGLGRCFFWGNLKHYQRVTQANWCGNFRGGCGVALRISSSSGGLRGARHTIALSILWAGGIVKLNLRLERLLEVLIGLGQC